MENKYKLLIKDTLIFAFGSIGSKVILFLLVPLYTNCLSTAEYGAADLVSTFSTLLSPIVSVSIARAIVRFGMKDSVDDGCVLLNSLFVFFCSVIITLLIIPLLKLYETISPWRYYLFFEIILTNAVEIGKYYLKLKNKNMAYSIIGICHTFVLAIANVISLLVLKTGVKGYLFSINLALAISLVLYLMAGKVFLDLKGKKINFQLLREMLRYSFFLVFSSISWWILHASDKLMIEWMIGASALGIYTVASKIPSLINVVIGFFNQSWSLSSIRENEAGNYQKFYSEVFNFFLIVILGLGLFLILISNLFVSIYIGPNFKDAVRFVPFLLFAAVFYSIFSFIGSLYEAFQKTFNDMSTSFFCALLNIIINYVAIKKIGIGGAVMGTAVSYSIFAMIRLINVSKYINLNVDVFRLVINMVLLLLAAMTETFSEGSILYASLYFITFFFVNWNSILELIRHYAKSRK